MFSLGAAEQFKRDHPGLFPESWEEILAKIMQFPWDFANGLYVSEVAYKVFDANQARALLSTSANCPLLGRLFDKQKATPDRIITADEPGLISQVLEFQILENGVANLWRRSVMVGSIYPTETSLKLYSKFLVGHATEAVGVVDDPEAPCVVIDLFCM